MEDNMFNKEKVIDAIQTTIVKPNSRNQNVRKSKAAKKYLEEFKKSFQYWTISCEILETENLDTNVVHRLSNILKEKLQFEGHELPESQYLRMSQLLIKLLSRYIIDISIVEHCLVYLYLHAFQTIGDLVEISEEKFLNCGNKGTGLEIMRLMANVLEDPQVMVSPKQKERYQAYLQETLASKVFVILDRVGKDNSCTSIWKNYILGTFEQWLFLCRKDELMNKNIAAGHSCFTMALETMKSLPGSKAAALAIKSIIKAINNPENNQEIFETIFKHIKGYMEEFRSCLKNFLSGVRSLHLDWIYFLRYVKVFGAFGLKLAKTMIIQPAADLKQFLEFMVEITTGKTSTEILTELVKFWEGFSKEYMNLIKESQSPPEINELTNLFKGIIIPMIKFMELDDEQLHGAALTNGKISNNDKSQERKNYGIIISSVQDIIGFATTLNIILEYFKEESAVITSKTKKTNPNWKTISTLESILYAAKSSVLKISGDKRPDISQFFEIVLRLSLTDTKFNTTKIQLIEEAAQKVTVDENITRDIFTYLGENLKNLKFTDISAQALVASCQNWSNYVFKNFPAFLLFADKLKGNNDFLAAIGVAIVSDTQTESREKYLAQLCNPFLTAIKRNIESSVPSADKKTTNIILKNLEKIQSILSKMPTVEEIIADHPLVRVYQEDLWPLLKELVLHYEVKPYVAKFKPACRVLMTSIVVLGINAKPFVLDFLDLICRIYVNYPSSALLYHVEKSVGRFGQEPDLIEPLTIVYRVVSSATLNFISTRNLALGDNQIVEDLFGMAFRYVKYIPSAIISCGDVETLLDLSEICIDSVPGVRKTLYLFLEFWFRACENNPQDETGKVITELTVNKYGRIFVTKMIQELLKCPEARVKNGIFDTLFSSLYRFKKHTLEWLEEGFQKVPEAILPQKVRTEILTSLGEIDFSKVKLDKEDEKNEELAVVSKSFNRIFEHFSKRCEVYLARSKMK